MNRRKLGRAGLAAIAATTVLTVAPHAAGAFTSSCKISEFPASQASQSALNYSCLFTNGAGAANELSSAQTFHDFANVSYHQGAARSVTLTTALALHGTVITATGGHFTAADVNHGISGVGISPRAFIKAVTATTATLNQNATATVGAPVGTVLKIENTYTRSVADAVNGNATTALSSATANFNASDVGKGVSGTNIKPGTTIASVTPTTAVLSQAGLACGATPLYACSPQVVTIATTAPVTTARVITGTNTATVITSATGGFGQGDIGQAVNGGASYITAITATTATVTPAITANAVAHTITIGAPSASAPANGSAVLDLNVALALSPSLSAGAQSCAANTPTGFGLQGQWYNPGSFVTGGLIQPPTANAKVVGQVVFTTVLQFAAYVVQSPGDASIATPHYDIVWPLLPTGLAKCPSPSTVPVLSSFTINAVTASQNALGTGVGVPSSAQFRYLNPATAAQTGAVAKLVDGTVAGPAHTVWGPFTKTCNIPAPATNPALPGVVGSCETP